MGAASDFSPPGRTALRQPALSQAQPRVFPETSDRSKKRARRAEEARDLPEGLEPVRQAAELVFGVDTEALSVMPMFR